MKRREKSSNTTEYLNLEDRKLLAVGAELLGGNLVVSGASDGPVQIEAVDRTTFDVTDNGNHIATVEDVTGGIRIRMNNSDAETPSDDHVRVDLGGFGVRGIHAHMGGGENHLGINHGTVHGNVLYRGFTGNDSLAIGAETNVRDSVFARFGNGDNTFFLNADVLGNVGTGAGSGSDTVNVGAEATVRGNSFHRLRAGDNAYHQAGTLLGRLIYAGGQDADEVRIGADGRVRGSAFVFAGHGDNDLDLYGSVGGRFSYLGLSGNDDVNFHEDSRIRGSARMFLGGGDNTVTSEAHIGGNLLILSTNPDDSVSVNEELVEGRIRINLDFGSGGDDGGDE